MCFQDYIVCGLTEGVLIGKETNQHIAENLAARKLLQQSCYEAHGDKCATL